ncbi:substrate-binding domain-containing protein [Fodinicurvata sp. EGI_FJ10296]|uniref:substrate-binding domain-containing protein n=1 Tax=Fodinicurvata sp. EGI_FJ10296 TaxID=3231908 RepID=UPI0034562C01
MQGRSYLTAHWNALTLHETVNGTAQANGISLRPRATTAAPTSSVIHRPMIGPDHRRHRISPALPFGRARFLRNEPSGRPLNIGIFIPLSGAAGIWGPSCHRCADLAVHEINANGGVGGRPITMSVVDAGRSPEEVATAAEIMLRDGNIDALIGMHISAVRVALVAAIQSRIPYIYTPLYEGGETATGVYPIGETPNQQVRPAVLWFSKTFGTRRWALIGNDYIWPHVSHRAAHRYIGEIGGCVADDHFVPLGQEDHDSSIRRIEASKPDAVMVSLVGQDLVHFNRQFVARGLDKSIKRFCPALEENVLLALIPDAGEELYTSGAYFGSLRSAPNISFSTQYLRRFSNTAPVLNRFSALCYEGVRLYAEMVRTAGSTQFSALADIAEGLTFDGPRGRRQLVGNHVSTPIFIAKVEDQMLKTIHGIPNQSPGR